MVIYDAFARIGCNAMPDEYITVMYAESKENISGVTAFAAQCGYETIPHTMDGFGEIMYLTGKKSEVSKDFVNENDTKRT